MILAVSLGVVFVVLVVAAAVIWKSERTRRWFEDRISWGRYGSAIQGFVLFDERN